MKILYLLKIGEYDKAMAIYNDVEKARLELLGKNHPHYINTKYSIAVCLQYKGKYIVFLRILKIMYFLNVSCYK